MSSPHPGRLRPESASGAARREKRIVSKTARGKEPLLIRIGAPGLNGAGKRIALLTILLLLGVILHSCRAGSGQHLQAGADRMESWLSLMENRRVALVANHSSLVGGKIHLVDTLLSGYSHTLELMKVFSPEHGFRGEAGAGTAVDDGVDEKTGLPVISLYGRQKKPSPGHLDDVDIVVFDLQDVGVRFYTYISTLHYVMEACAENGLPLVVLDRPNPNGGYVDGPVLEDEHRSFVGMHPIPVVYGMTIGELARMINGEGWLGEGISCDLAVIRCTGYDRTMEYHLPVRPSPNLPNHQSVKLYPSLCFFEGTAVSVGRGTQFPFQVFGHPDLKGDFSFTPRSMPGMALRPKLEGKTCYGEDLREFQPEEGWSGLHLHWLLDTYRSFPDTIPFFTPYFVSLAGTTSLQEQIKAGWSEKEIRRSWQPGLDEFKRIRSRYLLYD